jgi:hypothetical protein
MGEDAKSDKRVVSRDKDLHDILQSLDDGSSVFVSFGGTTEVTS